MGLDLKVLIRLYFASKDKLVEHGDLPISRKRVGKGGYQTRRRGRESDDPLLITGSGVRIPHNPLRSFFDLTFLTSDIPFLRKVEITHPSLETLTVKSEFPEQESIC